MQFTNKCCPSGQCNLIRTPRSGQGAARLQEGLHVRSSRDTSHWRFARSFACSRHVLRPTDPAAGPAGTRRSEEHTSELQSLMRISYAVFCLKKKKKITQTSIKNIYNILTDKTVQKQ